jgi:hypothetical protein
MPESVRDRATTAHEFWFQLAKSKTYYWDAEAVRVASCDPVGSAKRYKSAFFNSDKHVSGGYSADGASHTAGIKQFDGGRNRRTSDFWNESLDARIAFYRDQLAHLEHVREHGGILLDEGGDPLGLHINTSGYKGAHFATFGEKLIAPLILGGTSARGVCPSCGASWERVTEKTGETNRQKAKRLGFSAKNPMAQGINCAGGHGNGSNRQTITAGWTPTCQCNAGPPTPCTVLDPFLGSGTTAATARRLGRNWIGIELSKEYCDEHIIPRLSEPLFEWAEQQEAEPVIEQGELFRL